jgi:hypothetical protein
MLGMYGLLESAENKDITAHDWGDYESIAPDPTNLFGAYREREITLISFINTDSYVDATDKGDIEWLEHLQAICTDKGTTNIMVIAVLYNLSFPIATDCNNALSRAGLDTAAVKFMVLRDDDNSVSNHYKTGLPGATTPFSYMFYKRSNTKFRITDKWHKGSTNNGDMDVELALNGASFSDTETFVKNRIDDHLKTPEIDSAQIPPRPTNSYGSAADVEFIIPFDEKMLSTDMAIVDPLATPPIDEFDSKNQISFNNFSIDGNGVNGSLTITSDDMSVSDGGKTYHITKSTIVNEGKIHIHISGIMDTTGEAFPDQITECPGVSVELVDDTAGSPVSTHIEELLPDSIPNVITHGSRSLTITIDTDYPGTADPHCTVTKPDGTKLNLDFQGGLTVSITDTELMDDGVYTVAVNPYENDQGIFSHGIVRRFIIDSAVDPLLKKNNLVEGWGYYPREEGYVFNCAEQHDPAFNTTVPFWTEDAGGADVSPINVDPVVGSPLVISTVSAGHHSFRRSYPYIFDNAGNTNGIVESGYGYLEAGVTASIDNTPTAQSARDSNGSDITYISTGAGLEIKNGPFLFSLRLIDISAGTLMGKRLAVRLFSEDGNDLFLISNNMVEWDQGQIIRIEKTTIDGVDGFIVKYRSMDSTQSFDLITEILLVKAHLLPGTDDPYTSEVAFGIFDNADQDITSKWEFVRYAFYDSKFEYDNTYRIGFQQTQRTGETSFYRSPGILINGDPEADPTVGDNDISASIFRTTPALFNGKAIPVKVRFALADWEEYTGGAPFQSSANGFFKNGLINYYKDYAADPTVVGGYTVINTERGVAVVNTTDTNTTSTTPPLPWNFSLDQDRLARRIFISAVVDAPLLPTPLMIQGIPMDDNLIADPSPLTDKVDLRCAVRQFLPDFYVRDTPGDDGIQNPGGWLSPDITIGVFAGESGSLPDPQGTDQTLYPAGFARDEDNDIYTPNGYIEISAHTSGETIKITDTGWSDYGTQCYYNRVWVRFSNRGIVPGPANVQVFFLGSALRAAFDPANARGNNYEKNYADDPNTPPDSYVQTKFQCYTPNGSNFDVIVEAIPPLSGASDWNNPREYVIAEYIWHFAEGDVPVDPADNHGCNAVTINLPNITGQPDWTSGVDTSPDLNSGNTVWAANQLTNNITVRNCNIAVGQPPATDDVTNKMAIDDNDDPVNYKKLSNNFRPNFSKQHAFWSMMVDTRKMPESETILRVPAKVAAGARIIGFKEVGLPKKAGAARVLFPSDILHAQGKYRYFLLKNGKIGALVGINPTLYQLHPKNSKDDPAVNIYYRLRSSVKPGSYEITISQAANKKVVGGYRTVIIVPRLKDTVLVGDERIDAVFDVKKYPEAMHAVPYGKRLPMGGVDVAIRRLYSISPNVIKREVRRTGNSIVNGIKDPDRIIKGILQNQSGKLLAAVVGRVLGLKGGIPGVEVELCSFDDKTLATGKTDSYGCYLITLIRREGKGTFPLTEWQKGELFLKAYKVFDKKRKLIGTVKRQVNDPFFAMPDMRCKY